MYDILNFIKVNLDVPNDFLAQLDLNLMTLAASCGIDLVDYEMPLIKKVNAWSAWPTEDFNLTTIIGQYQIQFQDLNRWANSSRVRSLTLFTSSITRAISDFESWREDFNNRIWQSELHIVFAGLRNLKGNFHVPVFNDAMKRKNLLQIITPAYLATLYVVSLFASSSRSCFFYLLLISYLLYYYSNCSDFTQGTTKRTPN